MTYNSVSTRVKNQPGALIKVASLISGRGINIQELNARVSVDPRFSLIDVGFFAEPEKAAQICARLEKLEIVREVRHAIAEEIVLGAAM